MKKSNLLLCLSIISIFFACTTEETEMPTLAAQPDDYIEEEPAPATPASPVSVPYLTIIVDNDYNNLSVPSEDWILVHRENGDLYNYVPVQNGNTIVLEALDTVNLENMTVTKLRITDFSSKTSYGLSSFGKIQPGRTMTLSGFSSTPLPDLGQADITVNNVPGWNGFSLTNTQNHTMSELSQYHAYNQDFDPSIIAVNGFSFKETTDYIMTVIDANWTPSYALLNGLTNGASITLDGSTQLNAFDQITNVPINSTINNFSFNVSALNSVANTRFQLYWATTPNPNYVAGTSTSFSLGYLNGYQDYETDITMGNSNTYLSFKKKGSPVNTGEVVFPTATTTINDNTFTAYDYTSTANELINVSRWIGGTQFDSYSINWLNYGPNDEVPLITEMPLVDFPELDFANISFYSTSLCTQGDDYDVYIGDLFGDGTATTFSPVIEWFSYTP